MEGIRKKRISTKEQDIKSNRVQRKNGTWQNGNKEERQYRVVSDDNSIYEYDLTCVREKTESN